LQNIGEAGIISIAELQNKPHNLEQNVMQHQTTSYAEVMELADVLDSKSSGSDTVSVRPRPSAPKTPGNFREFFTSKYRTKRFTLCSNHPS
jgi:hypothetical protein